MPLRAIGGRGNAAFAARAQAVEKAQNDEIAGFAEAALERQWPAKMKFFISLRLLAPPLRVSRVAMELGDPAPIVGAAANASL